MEYNQYEPQLDSRIDLSALLKIDFSKTLLIYKGIPFIVVADRAENIFRGKNGFYYSQRVGAGFKDVEWHFMDKDLGKMECIVYTLIEVDPEIIPHPIIDVLFFHELKEMFYRKVFNNPKGAAHQKARKDERDYANKFLSPTEKQIYEKFCREFRPIKRKIQGEKV
ncbi:MAG: hypothetical protein CO031_02535 [Candidatus Nealsonbacteria bacterium CG_4_9_14_0_2_um_filter_37_38]|uniref:Uncharacterized protein n=1 Tax=Candidatus Nealsonbacteria bacterium CG_4_10_14_0_8_um_filter_37_14 TaxID=1974684 RepID=A0A2M7R6T9_9BACT|nr:MAG: hypothetical protein COV63_01775 [Candidatus Nealsonbacteria bacterium CG11_big_fil_rev_8_21_14_0_20_37_68]PIY89065.1 MAG: hypothetical protein COY73_02075 [Candidatus Nealsonbacteria bacterium CG_4_10_14_0_8_um_filter_37_14]PJC51468.1 MAG: hypothetical protein CO031_02535 [Candidatus Nealsonbacteria bacterium CG_4_9_14_0_2_um_filter_37_38]